MADPPRLCPAWYGKRHPGSVAWALAVATAGSGLAAASRVAGPGSLSPETTVPPRRPAQGPTDTTRAVPPPYRVRGAPIRLPRTALGHRHRARSPPRAAWQGGSPGPSARRAGRLRAARALRSLGCEQGSRGLLGSPAGVQGPSDIRPEDRTPLRDSQRGNTHLPCLRECPAGVPEGEGDGDPVQENVVRSEAPKTAAMPGLDRDTLPDTSSAPRTATPTPCR